MYAHTCVQMLRIMSEVMSEGPQNVSVNVDGRKMMQVGQVIVTPITSRSSLTPVGLGLGRRSSTASSTTRHPVVEKVMLKAVLKSGKKASRSFALRNLNPACVNTCDDLKALIRAQLTGDITSKDFDIGYCQGSSVVGLRSTEDLNEVWGKLSTTSLGYSIKYSYTPNGRPSLKPPPGTWTFHFLTFGQYNCEPQPPRISLVQSQALRTDPTPGQAIYIDPVYYKTLLCPLDNRRLRQPPLDSSKFCNPQGQMNN